MRGATLNFPKGKHHATDHDWEHPVWASQVQRMRYEEFVLKLKTEKPNAAGLECDRYDFDELSEYLVGVRNDVVVFACRLINGKRCRITLDSSYIRSKNHAEISRVVGPAQNGEWYMFHLYAAMISYAFEHRGYEELYCDTRWVFYRKLRMFFRGRVIEELGSVKTHKKNGQEIQLIPTRITRSVLGNMMQQLMQERLPHVDGSQLLTAAA
jgi:N-acyl-L-homoserine lactone synthetase